MTTAATDIQSLLVSLGAAPVQPTLPAADATRSALECLRIARETAAFRALDGDLRAGSIDRQEFFRRLSALIADMDDKGLFGEHGTAKS
jgi:hypothetical protein